jgi:hypothetical protein
VNRLLLQNLSIRKIGAQLHLGYCSVGRHRRKCLAKRLADIQRRRDVLQTVDTEAVLGDLLGLKAKLQAAIVNSDATTDRSGYAALCREFRACLESFTELERLAQAAAPASAVNFIVSYDPEVKRDRLDASPSLLPYQIVRPDAVHREDTVEAEVIRPAEKVAPCDPFDRRPPPPPEPRRLPPAPSALRGVIESEDQRGMMPEGWREVMSGERKL